jgi:hypothetical protein
MPLIKCKECGAKISEQAESCPRCGIKGAGRKTRTWIDSLNAVSGKLTAVLGTLVIPAARATLQRRELVEFRQLKLRHRRWVALMQSFSGWSDCRSLLATGIRNQYAVARIDLA